MKQPNIQHYEKIGVSYLGLQLGFSCNFESQWSLAWVAKVVVAQLTVYEIVYIYNLWNYVATRSLQLFGHYVATTM
jgi:hypothetical protein